MNFRDKLNAQAGKQVGSLTPPMGSLTPARQEVSPPSGGSRGVPAEQEGSLTPEIPPSRPKKVKVVGNDGENGGDTKNIKGLEDKLRKAIERIEEMERKVLVSDGHLDNYRSLPEYPLIFALRVVVQAYWRTWTVPGEEPEYRVNQPSYRAAAELVKWLHGCGVDLRDVAKEYAVVGEMLKKAGA